MIWKGMERGSGIKLSSDTELSGVKPELVESLVLLGAADWTVKILLTLPSID